MLFQEIKIIVLLMNRIIAVANLCFVIIVKNATNLWVAISVSLTTQKPTNVINLTPTLRRVEL